MGVRDWLQQRREKHDRRITPAPRSTRMARRELLLLKVHPKGGNVPRREVERRRRRNRVARASRKANR